MTATHKMSVTASFCMLLLLANPVTVQSARVGNGAAGSQDEQAHVAQIQAEFEFVDDATAEQEESSANKNAEDANEDEAGAGATEQAEDEDPVARVAKDPASMMLQQNQSQQAAGGKGFAGEWKFLKGTDTFLLTERDSNLFDFVEHSGFRNRHGSLTLTDEFFSGTLEDKQDRQTSVTMQGFKDDFHDVLLLKGWSKTEDPIIVHWNDVLPRDTVDEPAVGGQETCESCVGPALKDDGKPNHHIWCSVASGEDYCIKGLAKGIKKMACKETITEERDCPNSQTEIKAFKEKLSRRAAAVKAANRKFEEVKNWALHHPSTCDTCFKYDAGCSFLCACPKDKKAAEAWVPKTSENNLWAVCNRMCNILDGGLNRMDGGKGFDFRCGELAQTSGWTPLDTDKNIMWRENK